MKKFRLVLSALLLATQAQPSVTYAASPPKQPTQSALITPLRHDIKTVFVLFQENRSFDHYFGTFPGADGLFSDGSHPRSAAKTPGFIQPIRNIDGRIGTISPFRIGDAQQAADIGNPNHTQRGMTLKMDVVNGTPRMDRFALTEASEPASEGQFTPLATKQRAELNMAYVDCDTIPFLWRYARNFTLFDHMFQTVIGSSTPNAIAVIAGQSGETQRALHPDQTGVPMRRDPIAFWGSNDDPTQVNRQPANPRSLSAKPKVAPNLTFANLMLLFAGKTLPDLIKTDQDAAHDLADVRDDITAIAAHGKSPFDWEWYQEGYDKEPNEAAAIPASGDHNAYVGHHNAPQYFGYVSNNPGLSRHEHGLGDFFADIAASRVPQTGLIYVRGGYGNIAGLVPPAAPGLDPKHFLGDDDHPGYSDSQISEALVAREINAIVRSPYWPHSAIIVIYDESGGFYDHEPPRLLDADDKKAPLGRGPRFPMILISPYARDHAVAHGEGDHNDLLAFVEQLFGLGSLAALPDEQRAKALGPAGQYAAPRDDRTANVLLSGFDPARLLGHKAVIAADQAIIPDAIVTSLPHYHGDGCKMLGIVPEDARQNIHTVIPADFSPRPEHIH